MNIAILGFPLSGKTTVFAALTQVPVAAPLSATVTPHLGTGKVPDPRLDALELFFHAKKKVPAEVIFTDLAQPAGAKEGIGGALLPHLAPADAFLVVVRAFSNERVPPREGRIDAAADLADMEMELAFSDLAVLERRLERMEIIIKSAKPQEREPPLREQALLLRIKGDLEAGTPLREQSLTEEE